MAAALEQGRGRPAGRRGGATINAESPTVEYEVRSLPCMKLGLESPPYAWVSAAARKGRKEAGAATGQTLPPPGEGDSEGRGWHGRRRVSSAS